MIDKLGCNERRLGWTVPLPREVGLHGACPEQGSHLDFDPLSPTDCSPRQRAVLQDDMQWMKLAIQALPVCPTVTNWAVLEV